jgi:hypothetical protein
MSNNITKLIDDLVEKKTFSLDALTAVKELRDTAEKQFKDLARVSEDLREQLTENKRLASSIISLESTVASFKARENALLEKEANSIKLSCEVEMYKKLAEQGKDFVGMIFRNQIIMTSKMEALAVPGSQSQSGYPTTVPTTETKTSS